SSLVLITVAAFATSSLFADDKPCCAAGAGHKNMTAMCEATFAKLDLTADQKAKMEKLAAECDKGGCTKETMAKMEKSAKGILSKEQFAAWKAACSGHMAEKTQS
ncbi:MAG: hypothetical protein ACXWGY_05725, partial [Chthoniobacterales bacterium]